jgi:hypothetical protein
MDGVTFQSATSDYPHIHTTSPHIGDPDNTTRIMDSGLIEDFVKQYITQLQNLQGELRTGREQQEQKNTNHSFATTNSTIPAEISRMVM